MQTKDLALAMGLGVAVGAVAVMMLPKQSKARKLACKAADKVEVAAHHFADSFSQSMDM